MAFILLILHLLLVPLNIYVLLDKKVNSIPPITLASIVTFGIISILYFWSKVLLIPFSLILSISLSINLFCLFSQRKNLLVHKQAEILKKWLHNMDYYHISALAMVLIATLLYYRYHDSFGAWDAVAIWNMHASFLAENTGFFHFLDPIMHQSHPDYPLLIPSLIAAFWNTLAIKSAIIPALIHLGIFYLLIYTIWKLIAQKNRIIALISIAILCLDRHFIARASSEYADTALALIYVIGIASLLIPYLAEKKSTDIILGFVMASGVWIKNDAALFLLLFIPIWLVKYRNNRLNQLKYLILGASPVLISLFYFKFQMAPANIIMVKTLDPQFPANIDIFHRLNIIATYCLKTLLTSFPIIILGSAILIYIRFKIKLKTELNAGLLLFATLLGYIAVYLITPYEIEWHVKHSITRLFHQLYPATILLMAYIISIFLNKKEAFIF